MKKLLYRILLLTGMICLSGCGKNQSAGADVTTDMTLEEIAKVIAESQQQLPEMNQIAWPEEDFSLWISDYYQIEEGQVEDGVILYGEGVEASEIAVLQLAGEKDAETAEAALTAYKESRAGVFEGYAPLQAALAENGIVVVNGRYEALLICHEPSAAKEAFLECFGKEGIGTGKKPQESMTTRWETEARDEKAEDGERGEKGTISAGAAKPETESGEGAGYDSASVLEAWRTGDVSGLSDPNRRILEAAQDVIAQEIEEGMSDYEKELAIHDWITGWCRFDYGVFGRSSSDGLADGSDTPYGVLIDRSAMCHGYSATFQLFMDMLDIECITVFGTPGANGVEHSWNMVRLENEWYCVDTAWDDPIGGSPGHTYFNVTSDYLRSGSIHRWDDPSIPEAEGTKYRYGGEGL